MMKLLDTLHRWTGGLIGLVLALMGLTGTILLHEHLWIGLPGTGDPLRGDLPTVAATTEKLMAMPGAQGIIYADERFGLHQLRLGKEAGAYASQSGEVVTRWASQWERPELWIFDFHHHLFTGHTGEWVIGIAGLCGLFFVVSGAILWWRTRRTFRLRLWPQRMSRPSIVWHHRDLGIVAAPLLLISIVTGTMMIFRPFALGVVAPFGPVAETADRFDGANRVGEAIRLRGLHAVRLEVLSPHRGQHGVHLGEEFGRGVARGGGDLDQERRPSAVGVLIGVDRRRELGLTDQT